eukprot:TRINITY_DN9781_c0_g1_i4.p1 TRINITY_DN9781_c0_g1~~TRINITY_DN9781_c0_g1_i4.p1  ORF type:complete len:504 (+),score=104.29 TRINITY_DN9781_c0_g1_i4:116-1627(+)
MALVKEDDNVLKKEDDQTLFQIIGVEENATEDDIKKSFRKLAIKYHPDKNPDGAEMFQKIQNAYDILSDEEQRNQYIQLLAIQRNKTILKETTLADLKTRFRQFHDFRSNHRKKYERTCRDWARGRCKNEHCPYWHYKSADSPAPKRTQVCKDYLMGTCRFGDECIYAHTNVIPTDDNDAIYLREWTCRRAGCEQKNEIGKPMCSRCKRRRELPAPKFKINTQVILSYNKIVTIDEVIRRTLFLAEDGKTKQELSILVNNMKQMTLFGQVVGLVTAYFPSSECVMLRLGDGNLFLTPENFLQCGSGRWTCERCKFSNMATNQVCKLCKLKRGEDDAPACDTKRKRSPSPDRRIQEKPSTESKNGALIVAKTEEEVEREKEWVEARKRRQQEREARAAQRQQRAEADDSDAMPPPPPMAPTSQPAHYSSVTAAMLGSGTLASLPYGGAAPAFGYAPPVAPPPSFPPPFAPSFPPPGPPGFPPGAAPWPPPPAPYGAPPVPMQYG